MVILLHRREYWKFDRVVFYVLKCQLLVISATGLQNENVQKNVDQNISAHKNDSISAPVKNDSLPSQYVIHPNVTITSVIIPYEVWINWPEEKLKRASSKQNNSIQYHLEGTTTETPQTKIHLRRETTTSVITTQGDQDVEGKEAIHETTTQSDSLLLENSSNHNLKDSVMAQGIEKLTSNNDVSTQSPGIKTSNLRNSSGESREPKQVTLQKDISTKNATTENNTHIYANQTSKMEDLLTTKNNTRMKNESKVDQTPITDNMTSSINASHVLSNDTDSLAWNMSKTNSTKIASSSLVHHSSGARAEKVKAYEPVPIEDGPFGSLIWRDKRYLMSVLIPIGVGIAGAIIIISMGYIVKYCPRPQPLRIMVHPQQETQQMEQTTSMSSADRMVLLMDSSDDEF